MKKEKDSTFKEELKNFKKKNKNKIIVKLVNEKK